MTSATSMPSADSTPACRGTITVPISSRRAISHACMPPAPAKRQQRKPRWDRGPARPRPREWRAPCWRWRRERCLQPGRRPKASSAAPGRRRRSRARSTSSVIRPPRKKSGSSRPSSRLASVTVSSVPDAVAHGPRRRTGAARSDAQCAAGVDERRSNRRRRRPCGCRSSAAGPESRRSSRRSSCRSRRRSGSHRWMCRPCRSEMTRRNPAARATARAPTTPAAGPDSTVRTACARAASRRDRAAVRLHDRERAIRRAAVCSRSEVAIDQRRDVGIDDGRAPALELAVLRQHFVRRAHAPAACPKPSGNLALVSGVRVRVQQTDGDDLGAAIAADRPQTRSTSGRSTGVSSTPAASRRSTTPNVSSASTSGRGSGTKML